jgi:hypothetical protein
MTMRTDRSALNHAFLQEVFVDKKYGASLQLTLQQLNGKAFKVVADTIRSGISNEHGFRANKGVTDERFKQWSIVIRFATIENRTRFLNTMKRVLHPRLVELIAFKPLTPRAGVEKPYRWVSNR